ncbi:hypothetical protein V6Z11_D04G050400 [Gossypium hirsutum]
MVKKNCCHSFCSARVWNPSILAPPLQRFGRSEFRHRFRPQLRCGAQGMALMEEWRTWRRLAPKLAAAGEGGSLGFLCFFVFGLRLVWVNTIGLSL